VICPSCQSDRSYRSHRSGIVDFLVSLVDLRPWRCRACDLRFFAWKVPISYMFYVHCPTCGNLDLQQISRDRVENGMFLGLQRLLLFPAYRCAPCRERFFSVRPYRPVKALSDEVMAVVVHNDKPERPADEEPAATVPDDVAAPERRHD
jgi:hypothetical protein